MKTAQWVSLVLLFSSVGLNFTVQVKFWDTKKLAMSFKGREFKDFFEKTQLLAKLHNTTCETEEVVNLLNTSIDQYSCLFKTEESRAVALIVFNGQKSKILKKLLKNNELALRQLENSGQLETSLTKIMGRL